MFHSGKAAFQVSGGGSQAPVIAIAMLNVKMSNGLLYLIAVNGFAIEGTNNAGACLTIAVRVDGLRHLFVGYCIIKECAYFVYNQVVIGANEMNCATFQRLGALCGVAHHEHGLAKARGLLLNAAGIGEHNSALLHQVNELQVLQGLNEEEVGAGQVFTKHMVNGLAHIGVEVHGVNEIYLRIFFAEVFHSCYHANETITKVLSAMACYQNQLLAAIQTGYIITSIFQNINLLVCQSLISLKLVYHHMEGIDNGITGDENLTLCLLLLQVMLAERCWSKVVCGYTAGNLAVHLLGPRAVDVMSTQTCLYVSNWYLLVEGCQGSSCAGSGIAMHQHHIGLALTEHVAPVSTRAVTS